MKKKFLVLFSVAILVALFVIYRKIHRTTFDANIVDNVKRFELVKNTLLNNKNKIKANKTDWSTTTDGYIFTSNKYYFKNSVLTQNQNIEGLKKVISLWDDKLIEDKPYIFGIWFQDDNTVGFTIKEYDSLFPFGPSILHLLIYDPTNKAILESNKEPNEVIKEKRIKKNWVYIIKKNYSNP